MSFWTLEQEALLIDMHGQSGEPSFSVIADAINREFGTDFSRRACIGKARRIHLPGRRASNQSTFDKQTIGRKLREPPKVRVRKPIIEPIEVTLLRCAEIVPCSLSLLDLEPGDCRYIVNDASPWLFCGHNKHDGSSYCFEHFVLSRRRMT